VVPSLRPKLQRLHDEIEYLESQQSKINEAEALAKREPGYAIQKSLQIAIESAIDIGRVLLSRHSLSQPDENRTVFEVLSQHEIIPGNNVDTYSTIVSFRNILVHEYVEVEAVHVFDALQNLADLKRLAGELSRAIEKKRSEDD